MAVLRIGKLVIAELFVVTMYAVGCDVKAGNPTKAGTQPVVGFTVAADPDVLPIGSIVKLDGFRGERMVHDVGSEVVGKHVDVFVGSCAEARKWGRRKVAVRVLHRPRRR